ncbi:MAG: methionyl-tRNA formyltransferase [Candidatus Eremiobacteraeota bacterium]|nr:methionyl-tRNA formyltransferase [Candidatus Eremiobacteraeota bacterium]
MARRRLRTIFFGSAQFSLPSLDALVRRHDVIAVVTQPDRPAGRGLRLAATPVSGVAERASIAVHKPSKLDATFAAALAEMDPELIAVASYGKIVPRAVLQIASVQAALNVHPSLLPQYRGATPIQSALRDGRTSTGVTIFWMVQTLDAGDIALSERVPIAPADTYGTLHDSLAHIGADLLLRATEQLVDGVLPRIPQNENQATFTKPLSKEELRLDCTRSADAVVDQIRALSPRPGAWIETGGARLKILSARAVTSGRSSEPKEGRPGDVSFDAARTLIQARPGWVEVLRLIPAGKPEMSGHQFAQRQRGDR